MPTELHPQPADYAKPIAAVVAQMPLERAAQVYDSVRFLQSHPAYPPSITDEDDDWLNDSEEQMQAEDELWNAAQARHQDQFAALAAVARTQIDEDMHRPVESGKQQPIASLHADMAWVSEDFDKPFSD
ncbi:MAG: hypothetical protein NT075_37475 [Chloroflexi bacterium]|nr:hypothetical protein [Chloroflexota bacterium]